MVLAEAVCREGAARAIGHGAPGRRDGAGELARGDIPGRRRQHPKSPCGGQGAAGPLIAFGAIPRIVFGPVLLVIEGVTFLLVRERVARALLAVAMLMDLIPLSLFALHLLRATRY